MKKETKNIATTINEYLGNTKAVIIDNGDTITKISDDEFELENTIKFLTKHPDVFPIIYNIKDNVIEMEKLNVEKAEKEFKILDKLFKWKLNIWFKHYLMRDYTYLLIYPNKSYPVIPPDFPSEYNDVIDRYQKLIDNIMKIVGKRFLLDVHSKNFGYDKNGTLKMFDI